MYLVLVDGPLDEHLPLCLFGLVEFEPLFL